MRTSRGVILLLIGLSLLAPAARAAVLHVPGQYATIQAAVDAAQAGDEIQIAAGTYSDPTHPAGGGDETLCCVVMKSGISLRGAGIGETIIDANAVGRGIHCYQVTGCVFSDMTIRNAYADVYGTGVFLRSAQATLERVEMTENLYGAIAAVDASDLTLLGCTMSYNEGKAGAGLDIESDCTAYIYDCDVIGNEGPTTGGVLLRGAVTMEHCRITNNTATGAAGVFGGGIGVLNGSPTLRFCVIRDNVSGGSGGGIYITGDMTTGLLEDCIIADNRCDGDEGIGGGLTVSSFATPTLRRCLVTGNTTTGQWSDGGGVYIQFSNVVMENCTLYGNGVGGTYGSAGNLGCQPLVEYNTISVSHCIMSGATAGMGVSCVSSPEVIDISCSNVWGNAGGDAVCGIGGENFSLDPLYCDAVGGNFHLQAASPCAPGNHPGGATACGGALIGAKVAGCTADVGEPPLQAGARLLGSQPNPFEHDTLISFALAEAGDVNLEVFDPSGRRVARLQEGPLGAGEHHVRWDGTRADGSRAASGVYFYRLQTNGVSQGMRLLLLD